MKAEEWAHYYKEKYPLSFARDDVDLTLRYKKAWKLAGEAATLLKERFGARKVVVFGSLTDRSRFKRSSDIDLAAWGIPDEHFYAAVGAVTGLSAEFKVDLVDAMECPERIRRSIESEGIEV
jgi:predicted nucleotidyltransferase